ncbi:MAG: TetR/AcrR family transcriptional regulator, partial [Myxococcota bacterium]
RMPRLTPRKKPQQDRSRALVAAMLEATRRVLLKDGFEATTVGEIARVAGVSPGSVYQYFPTKEAIISALHVSLEEDAVAYLAENLLEAQGAPLDEVAGVIAGVMLQVARDDEELLRALSEAALQIGTSRKLAPVRQQRVQLVSGFLSARNDVRTSSLAAQVLMTSLSAVIDDALRTKAGLDDALFEELRVLTIRYLQDG